MSKCIDITGQKFGRLTVIEKDSNRITNSGSYWLCKCECGNIKSCRSSSLRRGEIQSCGCIRNERSVKGKEEKGLILDLVGQRFGLLTVLEKEPERAKGGSVKWKCKCDCGNIVIVRSYNLTRKDENRTISCGCAHRSSGEIYIKQLLDNNKIKYQTQYSFDEKRKYKYDFAILKDNLPIRLIEFDGEGHYKEIDFWRGSLEIRKKRDKEKNLLAFFHNIPLVRIPYWERDNITLEMLFSDEYLVKEDE